MPGVDKTTQTMVLIDPVTGLATGAAGQGTMASSTSVVLASDYFPAAYSSSRKTADGQVKASAGILHAVSISPLTATPTAGLLTIYDSLTETGTILYTEWIFATTPGHTVILDVAFAIGLFVGYDATLTNVATSVSYH